MKLFFDLETTGLPKQKSYDENYPPEELDKYESARIVEIAIILVKDGKIYKTYTSLVKPNNFTSLIPKITEITGITDTDVLNEGKDFKDVLDEIKPLLKEATVINSYNINFDVNILEIEPEAELSVIRKAYLRQMSKNHPDKLVSQAPSEEVMLRAKDHVNNIRNAYEILCDRLGAST